MLVLYTLTPLKSHLVNSHYFHADWRISTCHEFMYIGRLGCGFKV